MNDETAEWIRAVAWRDQQRRTLAECPTFYSLCACQFGQCGHCVAGRHHACTHDLHRPAEHPAAHLTDLRGHVLALVWEAGHRHVWTCASSAVRHGRVSEQATLF